MTSGVLTPVGLNHLVVNVRDIEESHAFWTEIVRLKQVGELRTSSTSPDAPCMCFHSGNHGNGVMSHHDIALVEDKSLPPLDQFESCAIGHVAFALPDREAWLRQIAFLHAHDIKFERRVEHGMLHSVYIRDRNGYSFELMYELPREMWEGNIDAALNHAIRLPMEGSEALQDRFDGLPVFAGSNASP